jgi:hypothetical protein
MKKIISFLLSIAVVSLLLVGCNSNKDVESEAVVKDFVTKMYTLEDYKKIDREELNTKYPNDQYTTKISKISTEKAMEEFIADRTVSYYINRLYDLHINSKITSISIDKQSTEKDGSIIYSYKAKGKFTFADTNEEKEEELCGQITVKKVKDSWVITQFNKVELPIEIMKK